MKLSVATVTWNSASEITEQLVSVSLNCARMDFEQIIVDNASADNTVDLIKEKFPRVLIIANKNNLGFGRAYNQAVKIATGEYFLYLNPDMKILSPLAPLVEYLDKNPDVGIVGAKLVNANGSLNLSAMPRRFPTVKDVILMFLKIPHLFPKVLDRYLYHDKNFNAPQAQEVDSVRGAFMLVRRELVEKLGWAFDPRYFLWWEDVDLCREAKRLGYKMVYHPGAECVDKIGQSFSRRRLLWKQWQFFKSAVKYFWKWRKQKTIIGIVGGISSGKDVAAEYISKKLSIPVFQISQPLKDIAQKMGIDINRKNLVELGTKIAKERGEEFLAKESLNKVKTKTAIITGMRQLEQINYLRKNTNFVLLAIESKPEIRFQRALDRKKNGEAATLEEFVKNEQFENSGYHSQRLFDCMKLADYTIKNDEGFEDFFVKIDNFCKERKL